MNKPILEIDAKGWGKLQANLPKYRLFFELYQNAKDEAGTTKIDIGIEPQQGRPRVSFWVEDDGPGFADLAHAYTLFAPSQKLGDPLKSGFMNMGEKCVVVGCMWMSIHTTSGMVTFNMEEMTRNESRSKRDRGTMVQGILRMTREEMDETVRMLRSLVVPEHITLTVNDQRVESRTPVRAFPAKMPTRLLEEGELVTRTRETTVELIPIQLDETPTLYELGIPVVAHDINGFHVNVGQKVILNKDRDNVTPAYMQAIRVLVLNNAPEVVSEANVSEPWVRAAASDERAEQESVTRVMDLRFGEKRVAFSPTDPEANHRAVSEGYTLIHGRTLSDGERDNAKRFNLLPNAHALFPTPKPYSNDPDAPPVEVVPERDWSEGMRNVVAYSKFLAQQLMGRPIEVSIVMAPNFNACYGPGHLDFSLRRLGREWFETIGEHTDKLIIHEFGHEYESNHLDEGYYRALCKLGAKFVKLALEQPKELRRFRS